MFLILMLAGRVYGEADFCLECHGVQEGTSAVFKNDVHFENTLSCADCHGGDPKINDMDKAKSAQNGFRVRVARQEVPLFCAGCHNNGKFMTKYKPALPTNQYALYSRSVHGRKLAAGKTEAAQCVDCHGVHNIRPASDAKSPANAKNITETCAKCHEETAAVFKQGRHRTRATCATCHGAGHDIQEATTAILTSKDQGCAKCHEANSGQVRTAAQIADLLTGLREAGAGSKDALARARVAVHSFNVAAVRRAIDGPPSPPATQPGAAARPSAAVPAAGAAAGGSPSP